MNTVKTITTRHLIDGSPLLASPEMRKALEDHVLPISGPRHPGEVVGLGSHYRLFAKHVSTTGACLPIYNIWTSGDAGPVAHSGDKFPDIANKNDPTPLMHYLRLNLSMKLGRLLHPLAGAEIQSFDVICATEGVMIFRRGQDTGSTQILSIENLELIGAIPWDYSSNHQRLAFKDYVDTYLAAGD